MAKSSYILLCKSASTDKDTNEVSVFHIIEKLQITAIPPPQAQQDKPGLIPVIIWYPIKLVAEWIMGSDDDINDEFSYEFSISFNGKTEQLPVKGTFKFEPNMPRQRISLNFPYPIHFDQPVQGVMVFENRIKKTTASDWSVQSYSVMVEPISPPS